MGNFWSLGRRSDISPENFLTGNQALRDPCAEVIQLLQVFVELLLFEKLKMLLTGGWEGGTHLSHLPSVLSSFSSLPLACWGCFACVGLGG